MRVGMGYDVHRLVECWEKAFCRRQRKRICLW